MGDVIIEDGNLFGDGVNVAARLEAIAPPSRICISGSVHSLLSNNVKKNIYSKGEQKHNVQYRVYRGGQAKPTWITTTHSPTSQARWKPSTVLPLRHDAG